MPSCFSDVLIKPIPKGNNKDYSLSSNYHGIALASCFSKVIELCNLELHGEHLLSSHLLPCVPVCSRQLYLGIFMGAQVYGCLLDASKVLMTVQNWPFCFLEKIAENLQTVTVYFAFL